MAITPINRVRKTKERLLYLLDSLEDLKGLDVPSILPKGAMKTEVTCKPSRQHNNKGKYILEIDYIISLEVIDLKLKEEDKENGTNRREKD